MLMLTSAKSIDGAFKKTFTIHLTLPRLSVSFNASWYVALYAHEIISEDTADWIYVCARREKERLREIWLNIWEK